MSPPVDPEYEARVLAAIREPLVAAIADTAGRSRARAGRRLVAATFVVVLVAGGAVALWRANRGGGPDPQVRVAPSSTTSTVPGPLDVCAGAALTVIGTGDATTLGSPGWYVELRNDAPYGCAVPYPTRVNALDAAGRRVDLAGIDHTAGPGPQVIAGRSIRVVFSAPARCLPTNDAPDQRFGSLVVTVGDRSFPTPGIELVLCEQGVGAVRFEDPPIAPVRDPRNVDLGDGRTVRLRYEPRGVGSGIGNGATATPDGSVVAYEYDGPEGHLVATVDTATCRADGCSEHVVAAGHSPVLAADGRLAYVALDDGSAIAPDEALWQRSGSVTVRDPNGTGQVWASGAGWQTIAWAGDSLLVARDDPGADTEGFEALALYRRPFDDTDLSGGLVAISPDGTRLLLTGDGDQMLALYDIATRRTVDSISIADYERALVPADELAGVDTSRWPGFEESQRWPMTCCATFTGQSLWRGDLVLFPTTYHQTRKDRPVLSPTLVRITGDRIVPLRALRVVGYTDDVDAEQWVPGSTTDFLLKRSDVTPARIIRCHIEGTGAVCASDATQAPAFDRPAVFP